jgi:shikimate kinase
MNHLVRSGPDQGFAVRRPVHRLPQPTHPEDAMSPRPAPHAAARDDNRPPLPAHGPLVVLCGPMGSGKTSVGQALARRWSVDLRDTDADVEERAGADIPEIFLRQGEEEFRRLEHEAVAAALAEHRGILALGGGAVLRADTQAELAAYVQGGGVVVFLDVSIAYAAPRVGLDESRPLLRGNPRQRWIEIMRERRETYESVATMRTLTDGMTAGEVAREIERRLRVAARDEHARRHHAREH